MIKHTIIHFVIPSENPKQLAEFYAQLFDWKINKMDGDEEYWLIETPNGLTGGISRKTSQLQRPINFISVNTLQEAITTNQKNGGQLLTPPQEIPDGYWAQLEDPEGNRFAVFESKGEPS